MRWNVKKKIRIKTLEELINQPREGKFDAYEFDELSYTCLLCDIRMIILENKKQKEVIDKAIDHLNLFIYDENLSKYDFLKILIYTKKILKKEVK